jgi:hypothetical protein
VSKTAQEQMRDMKQVVGLELDVSNQLGRNSGHEADNLAANVRVCLVKIVAQLRACGITEDVE